MKPTSVTFTTTIRRPADDVYDFLRDPSNFPKWVTSFCQSIKNVGGKWIMETTLGPHEVEVVRENAYRVCDHYVRPVGSNSDTYVPMRVVPNGEDACTVLFTLNRTPDMSDARFTDDCEMVQRDIDTLTRILAG